MLLLGFGTPAVGLRLQPLSHGLQMQVLKHTDVFRDISQCESRLGNGSDQSEARSRKVFFVLFTVVSV